MTENNKSAKKPHWRLLLLLLITVIVIFGARWVAYERPPLPQALEALQNDELVLVTSSLWLTFTPSQGVQEIGFIFYPGGRIDPQGYSDLMRAIAEMGYLVVVPEMPLNMAVFNPNVAEEIISSHPEIGNWVIGGHSVGGTMAAQYTDTHREQIVGLVIWASYPADNADLSTYDGSVVSIYGSEDPRVNQESVEKRKVLLPKETTYVEIEGGDHHQFGSYEIDPKDHAATIDRDSQHDQILEATLFVLNQVANPD
jgi:predicted esterase